MPIEFGDYIDTRNPAGPLTSTDKFPLLQDNEVKETNMSNIRGAGSMHYLGNWNNTTAFPSSGGNGAGGAPGLGDIWRVSHDDGLTVGGDTWPQGSLIMPLVDTPGQTVSNWLKFAMQL